MISISDALVEIIQKQPFIEEGLSRGIINCSAYAREIRPLIEKKLYKPTGEGAIVMALKRLSQKLNKNNQQNNSFNLTNLTVRSNLTEFTFLNSEILADKQRQLFNELAGKKDIFCTVSQGVRETTFIVNQEAALALSKIFSKENILATIKNLSSITIQLPIETVTTSGVYYQILKLLALEKINVVEVISTYTEITIVFNDKDIDKAFSVLKKLNNPL